MDEGTRTKEQHFFGTLSTSFLNRVLTKSLRAQNEGKILRKIRVGRNLSVELRWYYCCEL